MNDPQKPVSVETTDSAVDSIPDPRAMEEWKQLQMIIGRLEGFEFQIRGWLLVLLGALIAALFSQTTRLTSHAFLPVSLLMIIAFCITELSTRVPKRESIRRSRDVERALRTGDAYDGPRIVDSLTDGPRTSLKSMAKEFFIANVFFFYLPMIAVVVIVSIAVK